MHYHCMNHSLAKELKDAGFPQKGLGRYKDHSDLFMPKEIANFDTDSYCPTLEELIDACGDEFWNLHSNRFGGKPVSWTATSYTKELVTKADTRIESVARLWLALNPVKPAATGQEK